MTFANVLRPPRTSQIFQKRPNPFSATTEESVRHINNDITWLFKRPGPCAPDGVLKDIFFISRFVNYFFPLIYGPFIRNSCPRSFFHICASPFSTSLSLSLLRISRIASASMTLSLLDGWRGGGYLLLSLWVLN